MRILPVCLNRACPQQTFTAKIPDVKSQGTVSGIADGCWAYVRLFFANLANIFSGKSAVEMKKLSVAKESQVLLAKKIYA